MMTSILGMTISVGIIIFGINVHDDNINSDHPRAVESVGHSDGKEHLGYLLGVIGGVALVHFYGEYQEQSKKKDPSVRMWTPKDPAFHRSVSWGGSGRKLSPWRLSPSFGGRNHEARPSGGLLDSAPDPSLRGQPWKCLVLR